MQALQQSQCVQTPAGHTAVSQTFRCALDLTSLHKQGKTAEMFCKCSCIFLNQGHRQRIQELVISPQILLTARLGFLALRRLWRRTALYRTGLQDGVYNSCVLSYLLATLHSPRHCGHTTLCGLCTVCFYCTQLSQIRVCVMLCPTAQCRQIRSK